MFFAIPGILASASLWLFLLTRYQEELAPLIEIAAGFGAKSKMAAIFASYGLTLNEVAKQYKIPVSTATAILAVESGGNGFGKSGKLLIRFEPKVFFKRAGVMIPDSHHGQDAEYTALKSAIAVNKTAAYQSISMGLAQVMGFNHKIVGHDTPEAMYDAFQDSARAQISAMFKFIGHKAVLLKAAQDGDFAVFARHYNGPGFVTYDKKIANAKQAFVDALGFS